MACQAESRAELARHAMGRGGRGARSVQRQPSPRLATERLSSLCRRESVQVHARLARLGSRPAARALPLGLHGRPRRPCFSRLPMPSGPAGLAWLCRPSCAGAWLHGEHGGSQDGAGGGHDPLGGVPFPSLESLAEWFLLGGSEAMPPCLTALEWTGQMILPRCCRHPPVLSQEVRCRVRTLCAPYDGFAD